jgi:putative membrane protein
VSGGVLAVVFGLYRPFMETLTDPRRALPRYWRRFLPVGVGWCLGVLGFAHGLTACLALSDTVTTWLFIGLIAGTVPSLFREAGREGRGSGAWFSLAVCAGGTLAGLCCARRMIRGPVTPNFWWYTLCGALWGAGVVVPGMTSASIMMALGLYQPLLEGVASLDLGVLAPCLPGMALTVLLLARTVNWVFRRYYAVTFHGILGMVLASALAIVPTSYSGAGEALWSLLCGGGGFALALLLSRWDQKLNK